MADVLPAQKVRQRIYGPHNAPFAQCLDLGWVVVVWVCLGNVHRPTVNTLKTVVLENGHPSVFEPCSSLLQLKEVPHTNRPGKAPKQTLGQTFFASVLRMRTLWLPAADTTKVSGMFDLIEPDKDSEIRPQVKT